MRRYLRIKFTYLSQSKNISEDFLKTFKVDSAFLQKDLMKIRTASNLSGHPDLSHSELTNFPLKEMYPFDTSSCLQQLGLVIFHGLQSLLRFFE